MGPVHHMTIFLSAAMLGVSSGYSNAQQLLKATLLSNAIHLDTSQVKAGTVTFDVHNAAENNLVHELVVLKTPVADDALPVRKGQVPERKFQKMGEVEDVAPGKSRRLTIKLFPGHYVLVCNKPGHYSMGMHTSLTVTP
ncbi:plastocyanin/azurin family copper-binding protein [Trinickia mobilis]|uniref:plastocyanin/azurin family copper-binding protein n=1 Tax=Trinickia mobilis TaxID=2816356 RepID=UPI001A8F4D5F|nr:plastocyanin/azurin family copper-binding protein [Trinickia mobilis]